MINMQSMLIFEMIQKQFNTCEICFFSFFNPNHPTLPDSKRYMTYPAEFKYNLAICIFINASLRPFKGKKT